MDVTFLYLKDMTQFVCNLTPDEFVLLSDQSRAGDQASRDKLVTANLRLGIRLAKRYVRPGIPLEDLVQEANLGLIKAARLYNHEIAKFSTFAYMMMRQRLEAYVSCYASMVYVPKPSTDLSYKLGPIRDLFQVQHGRLPTDEELAALSGRTVKQVATARLADHAKAIMVPIATTGPDRDTGLGPLQPAACDSKAPYWDFIDDLVWLRKAITRLPARDADIMRLRAQGKTLREIGMSLGVTKERVRQYEWQAVYKLKKWAARERNEA